MIEPKAVVDLPSGGLADFYVPDGRVAGLVLLWHGRGSNERSTMAPLASEVSRHGVAVRVPDWRPDQRDQGRDDLLGSIRLARDKAFSVGTSDSRVVVAGWSLGAVAALGVALDDEPGWHPVAVVGIAGGYASVSPLSGQIPLDLGSRPSRHHQTPVTLLHGLHDHQVSIDQTRTRATVLASAGRPVTSYELETDHAGIIMTRFDPTAGRCVPSDAPDARIAGAKTAVKLAQATH